LKVEGLRGGKMKILVTGGAGFVGSHVAEYYANAGDEITVFDNLSRAELLGYEKPFYQT
jgi:nucleoside-diphosphate-sugar epimerase